MSKIEILEYFFHDFGSPVTQLTTKIADIGIGDLHPGDILGTVLKVGVDLGSDYLKISNAIYIAQSDVLNDINKNFDIINKNFETKYDSIKSDNSLSKTGYDQKVTELENDTNKQIDDLISKCENLKNNVETVASNDKIAQVLTFNQHPAEKNLQNKIGNAEKEINDFKNATENKLNVLKQENSEQIEQENIKAVRTPEKTVNKEQTNETKTPEKTVNKEQTNETKTPEKTVNKEQTNDKGKGVDDYSPSM